MFTFGFYNSQNGDRKYNAEHISAIFDDLITDGVFASQGEIFGTVPGVGMQVIVKSGRGWFGHTWNHNSAGMPLMHAVADVTRPRYDAVIIEINSDSNVRTNSIKILTGDPSVEPVKPEMIKTTNLKQWPLAYVLIPPGITQITSGYIEVAVGTSECPFVTGILETANIDVLFQQWENDFNIWFDNLQASLEGNIAANLQNQINDRVKIADKATTAEAIAGTNDTKWMTPLKTAQTIDSSVIAIGDLKMSGRNLELESGGKFLTCDTRSLTVAGYPALYSAIEDRFSRPINATTVQTDRTLAVQQGWSQTSYTVSPLGIKTIVNTHSDQVHISRLSATNTVLGSFEDPTSFRECMLLFTIDEQAYVLIGPNDQLTTQDTMRLYTVSNTSMTMIWSAPTNTLGRITGFTRIGNTAYISGMYSSGTTGNHTDTNFVLSVTGNSASKIDINSGSSSFILGRTVYFGSPHKTQTDVASINQVAITNSVILDLVGPTNFGFTVGNQSAKVITYVSGSLITKLMLSDTGVITKQDISSISGGPSLINIDANGKLIGGQLGTNTFSIGREQNDGRIYFDRPLSIVSGTFGGFSGPYRVSTSSINVITEWIIAGYNPNTYYLNHRIFEQNLNQFYIPLEAESSHPRTTFIKAL